MQEELQDNHGYGSYIIYVYNTGNIKGDSTVGGIVGNIDVAMSKSTDFVKYIYNTGVVDKNSTGKYGALYGILQRISLQTEAYYLKGSCSQAGKIGFGGSSKAVELEESEMLKLDQFITNYMAY